MSQYKILDKVNSPDDMRKLSNSELKQLASDIRSYMVDCVSKTGGHLASSLGAVEIIIALHKVFHQPEDKIVFDVGHQAYAHKILTGRKEAFKTLRQKDGISGFPKRNESEYDIFDVGHASTSISAALGYARAMKLHGEKGMAVAVIGDGAMTGGLALEAMNDAGQANVPIIVILNDNNMSIAENNSGIHRQLTQMRTSVRYVKLKRKIVQWLDFGPMGLWIEKHMESFKNRVKSFLMPDLLFEQMGFTYLGPVDGHNILKMVRMLESAKRIKGAVLIHAVTKKGKGYAIAENNPEHFHGISPFDPITGECKNSSNKSNSDVFGEKLTELAQKDESIVAITAAMPSGTGLNHFKEAVPERYFDVGICEEHALTMAAGMAAGGLKPVVAMYSTFLQRGYDQILHDIYMQHLPVVMAVDRAGLVGQDGPTHQGIYDVAFLLTIPEIPIYSPATQYELSLMMEIALERNEASVIRFTRGSLMNRNSMSSIEFGKWEVMEPISEVTILATGCMVETAIPIAKELGVGLVNCRFIRPMDMERLDKIGKKCKYVITLEENTLAFGQEVMNVLKNTKVTTVSIPLISVSQATVAEQRKICGVSAEDIREVVLKVLKVK